MTSKCLVADIGGTNARFGIAAWEDKGLSVSQIQIFRAGNFDSVRSAANAYLEAVQEQPEQACFAVAGPVTTGKIAFTNSSWVLDVAQTIEGMSLTKLHVINDFQALAAGINYFPADGFMDIRRGTPETAKPVLVIGPGTGFGQALIVPVRTKDATIIPTEGGHVTFAPDNDLEIEILKFITQEHGRVSVERVLSGQGLINLHRALCAISDTPCEPMQASEITEAAVSRSLPVAVQAVDLFCAILGSVAGDATLSSGARGGIVLGGGILPKIRDILKNSEFESRFLNKGRMRSYLEQVPIRLIIKDGAALYGAAAILRERQI